MFSWHMLYTQYLLNNAADEKSVRFGNVSLFSPQIGVDIKNPKHTL
jgi:hypothetical protein